MIHVVMEPTTGIEPVNLILTKDVLYLLSYVGHRIPYFLAHIFFQTLSLSATHNARAEPRSYFAGLASRNIDKARLLCRGAGNGIRTRDPQLGRLTL